MILQKSDADCLSVVSQALLRGKVVIIPTDTVYGFSGIVPLSEGAIRRIKGRDEGKPFIQLIAAPEDITRYSPTIVPDKIRSLMPGALTVIVSAQNASGGRATTAFRCPDDEWLRSLIRACKAPLYSTSVNRSGAPVIADVKIMEKEFGSEVFCIVDGGAQKQSLPSTIVDITGSEIKILRQGVVRIESGD